MNALPGKQELLAFQSRWLRPAGILAILGSLLFAVGTVIQQPAVGTTDRDYEQLQQYHDHSAELIAGSLIQALGFVLFAFVLYVLFKSAASRTERMRRAFLPLVLAGPILFSVGALVIFPAIKGVADDFVEKRRAIEQQARAEGATENQTEPQPADQPRTGENAKTTTSNQATTTNGTTTTASRQEIEDERVDQALEDEAEKLARDSVSVQIGGGLRQTGAFALVFGLIYTPLWAMRTGLLTRFWASLGMALGVAQLLIPQVGPMMLVLWFAAIGLQLAGWWPGPRPPAWDAGEAVPWPAPGEEPRPPRGGPPGDTGGTVEGSGREVAEPPLPESAPEQPGGEGQGQRRRKRKRRQ